MKRNCSLEEISDGKLYGLNDMVKAGCGDCNGCSACCKGMGHSIVLDPYDVNRLLLHLNMSFEQLLAASVELNVVDGVILPNLKMQDQEDSCIFLNEQGRCSIHTARPGICRIFPLGRYYENDDFSYILQVHECKKSNRTKVKVSKWIDTPDIKKNELFIKQWHSLVKSIQKLAVDGLEDALLKQLNLTVLTKFYMQPFDPNVDFYDQFQARLDEVNSFNLL